MSSSSESRRIEELEQRVVACTSEREIATRELEAVRSELDALLYVLSHDLRAPMRQIQVLAEMCLENDATFTMDTARQFLGHIQSGSKHLSDQIDALCELATITRTALTPTAVNVGLLLSKIADRLRSSTPARTVHITIPTDVFACGDEALLRIALQLLFDNAWKYSSHTPDAEIVWGSNGTHNGFIEMYVRDNGAGFDMAMSKRLFRPFARLHTSSEFPGMGVGLAKVRRIVNRHGGRIWAEAQRGVGATFRFTLPQKRA
jgi:light-regulated signal transduction histidine kinase (bacteriophytochrome)